MSATAIHIHIGDPTRPQQSYSLKEALAICRLSTTSHFEKTLDESAGAFWLADNHGIKGAHPRFHHEHVEYMVAVVNGLMTDAEALDLWNLRRKAIPNELRERALAPMMAGKRRGAK